MRWPDELKDTSRAAGWLNKFLRAAKASAVVDSPEIRVSESTHGTTLSLRNKGGSGSAIRQFRIKTIQNDFYTCRAWNGTTEGDDDVYIARPFEHRVSTFNNRSIDYSSDGDVFTATYTYASATKRTKTVSGTAETQVLVPYFKADFHLIYAVAVSDALTVGASNTALTDPNDNPITLLDLNVDGRAWAKLESTGGN
jgi:hypothetical protein